jgi:hypothetical protein
MHTVQVVTTVTSAKPSMLTHSQTPGHNIERKRNTPDREREGVAETGRTAASYGVSRGAAVRR